ncbi:MAG: VanW family protein [Candidatus Parcubacteria bacterium]|nr:VanW family protein [Candidatus Parcubacteria bacterium]
MENSEILNTVHRKAMEEAFGRKAVSSQYPMLLPLILCVRRFVNNVKQNLDPRLTKRKSHIFFHRVIARHSSPLFRRLGDSDPRLQEGKIKNLEIAIRSLNGVIIFPGEIFSFWNFVGATTKKRGYVNGMLLSNGEVVEGLGGGLCQLSNLLYWLFLHTPLQVFERKHHSRDSFPDSDRSIPFGAGATIFYNLIDLKIKNTTLYPMQIKLWMSDSQLKGQILSTLPIKEKYHIKEKKHNFIETSNGIYRYNEIWRETLVDGKAIKEEKLMTNCARVMYKPNHIDIKI